MSQMHRSSDSEVGWKTELRLQSKLESINVMVFPRFCSLLLALFLGGVLLAQEETNVFDDPEPLNRNAQTGVAFGERIPEFLAPDQNGRLMNFEAIRGPKGAMLVFVRSADW